MNMLWLFTLSLISALVMNISISPQRTPSIQRKEIICGEMIHFYAIIIIFAAFYAHKLTNT